VAASDYSLTASEVIALSPCEIGRAGATITAGQVVVDDPSTGKLVLADANHATAAICGRVKGIAAHNASDGQPLAYVGNGGRIRIDSTTATGEQNETVYLSDTPGAMCSSDDAKMVGFSTVIGHVDTAGAILTVQIAEAAAAYGN